MKNMTVTDEKNSILLNSIFLFEMNLIPKISDESVEPNTEESVFTSTCTTTTETSIETTDCESSSCWEDTETEVGSDSDSDQTDSDETEFASDYGEHPSHVFLKQSEGFKMMSESPNTSNKKQ